MPLAIRESLESQPVGGLVLLVLLDDAYYGKFNVRFLIVGAASQISRIIDAAANASTVSNRLVEVPEIGRLEETEATELILRGFKQLEYAVLAPRAAQTIQWFTDRIAQHMQQLCLAVAEASVSEKTVTTDHIYAGIRSWILENLQSDYDDVYHHFEERESKVKIESGSLRAWSDNRNKHYKAISYEHRKKGVCADCQSIRNCTN